ncbi:class I SAM-dependent methyltransferase [Treponema sp. OMZ 787]|uniref:class I SAM-dependent methyltransferase n=1 Tax=Treponema sp. OMZ 787 TaxID=2563669 RepID=UPI0020A29A14|nr:class I SAM-dependent methyltransferase [Treponema sp. OMZ 787]UTC61874.1 class I SAM-dependent methyltransferase [Treponema sp. OMZ 787]
MKLYDLIAENYEDIFPLEKEKVDFIKTFCKEGKILDAGCATGELCFTLLNEGFTPIGIDLNTKMISIAQNKISPAASNIRFEVEDMLNIVKFGQFNAVFCFGNTLPHLKNKDEVFLFFSHIYKSLLEDGVFIFQILNYDKIISEQKMNFKIIENGNLIFKRSYDFAEQERLKFIINFTDKKNNESLSDHTFLLPLKQEFLKESLKKVGFKKIGCYSDYNFTPSDLTEYSTIYAAEK